MFVLAHDDDTLARVPQNPRIEPVDLRDLDLAPRWQSNQFAETRFLLSEESGWVDTDFVGVASTSFRRKWPDEPSLTYLADHLPRSPLLRSSIGLGPSLSRGNWIDTAESYHPGMAGVLTKLVADRAVAVSFHRVPQANTFVCSRQAFMGLRRFMLSTLDALMEEYGGDPPFGYRCRFCGTTDPNGVGRYGRDRHIGFLTERLTMLYFAQRPDIRFMPTRSITARGLAEYQTTEAFRTLRLRVIRQRRARFGALVSEETT